MNIHFDLEQVGKTSLLKRLKGKKSKEESITATKGVSIGKWTIDVSVPNVDGQSKQKMPVNFTTFDFSGNGKYDLCKNIPHVFPEMYYPAHQFFLSENAVYMLVWDMSKREAGIASLEDWLYCVQAKAPTAPVVIFNVVNVAIFIYFF